MGAQENLTSKKKKLKKKLKKKKNFESFKFHKMKSYA